MRVIKLQILKEDMKEDNYFSGDCPINRAFRRAGYSDLDSAGSVVFMKTSSGKKNLRSESHDKLNTIVQKMSFNEIPAKDFEFDLILDDYPEEEKVSNNAIGEIA